MLVLFKKCDVSKSRCGQNISSRSSLRRLDVDHGMRDGKGVRTIRDSHYHRGTGTEKKYLGGEWQQTRQRYYKSPTSKLNTAWARILRDRNIFCTWSGRRKLAGSNTPGAFSCWSWCANVISPPCAHLHMDLLKVVCQSFSQTDNMYKIGVIAFILEY